MQIVTTIAEARRSSRNLRWERRTLGLVPTMGALHAGHLSLVRAARESCDVVAATIFVNPLQFGPSEDFGKYPRTFLADCETLEREGVDLLFAPTPDEMYPTPTQTWVDVPEIGARLDGASRPGHFRGVATVVAKLFNILAPDRAFFGQKDAAQIAVLRAMVRDLNSDLELVVCPTVREPDGLAMSSRNQYLSPTERQQSLALSRALFKAGCPIHDGSIVMSGISEIKNQLRSDLENSQGIRLDYAEIVHPDTLEPVTDLTSGALIAVAAWVGATRLIDNIFISPQATS
jgi:pantoate--beta-alanine ligase